MNSAASAVESARNEIATGFSGMVRAIELEQRDVTPLLSYDEAGNAEQKAE